MPPYDAKAVANYFLNLAKLKNEKLDLMKLQKLIYFAHGWHLAIKNNPLLDELIQAWQYGPVVSSIYHEFKEFGNNPITRSATNLIVIESVIPPQFCLDTPQIDIDDDFSKKLLDKIWEQYGKLTAIQLSNMTHQPGTPWEETWKPGIPKGTAIDDKLIKEYFVSKAKEKKKAHT